MDESSNAEWMATLASDLDPAARHLLGLFDAPAYVRRALRVEDSLKSVEKKATHQREEFLRPIRRALAQWRVAADRSSRVAQSLSEEERRWLNEVDEAAAGGPSIHVAPSFWPARPARLFADVRDAVRSFHLRWNQWLSVVDLSPVNEQIESYNRLYLIEKECAFRSPRAASRGFRPMALIASEDIARLFPPIPEV